MVSPVQCCFKNKFYIELEGLNIFLLEAYAN
jgi:hypothetical protein